MINQFTIKISIVLAVVYPAGGEGWLAVGFINASVFAAEPSILTPPVDATVCLNSIAEFNCSTDGEYLVWRVNGTKADHDNLAIKDKKLDSSGIRETLVVPGIRNFENTNFTCQGGTIDDGLSTTSNPAQLFVQG